MSEKLLTVREVAHLLKLNEKEVIELAESGEIPAYKVAGLYLRFKKDQIEQIKEGLFAKRGLSMETTTSFWERFTDFWYYNDFYILSIILIFLMLYFVFNPR